MNEKIKNLAMIWLVKGNNAEYHDQMKGRLRKQWPLLYMAIESLSRDALHSLSDSLIPKKELNVDEQRLYDLDTPDYIDMSGPGNPSGDGR